MHLINIDDALVEDALVEIARHIPLDVEIGQPRGANRTEDGEVLIATGGRAVWIVDTESVTRYVQLGDGMHVVTSWRWGVTLCDIVGYDHDTEA